MIKAEIRVDGYTYNVVLTGFESLAAAHTHVVNTLDADGVFITEDEILQIKAPDEFSGHIRVYREPCLPAPDYSQGETLLTVEYETKVNRMQFLGASYNVEVLVYYDGGRVILMPLFIDGQSAYGYFFSSKNLEELTNKVAIGSMGLQPSIYTAIYYPGESPSIEEAVDYVRDYLAYEKQLTDYVPKSKNAKAFFGWREGDK